MIIQYSLSFRQALFIHCLWVVTFRYGWLLHDQGRCDRGKTKKIYWGHAAEQMIIALPASISIPPNKTNAERIDLFTETSIMAHSWRTTYPRFIKSIPVFFLLCWKALYSSTDGNNSNYNSAFEDLYIIWLVSAQVIWGKLKKIAHELTLPNKCETSFLIEFWLYFSNGISSLEVPFRLTKTHNSE